MGCSFHLVQQRVGTHHVGIALIELAVTPLLRTVGPPHGLNLITLEGEGKFVAVHHHKAGKGHGEVVAEPLLAQAGSQAVEVALGQVGLRNIREEIARVEHLEEQLVTLFAILAHEGLQGLHGRRLNLPESIKSKNLFYRIEYVIALGHLVDREIARTFGNGRFCHHIFIVYFIFFAGRAPGFNLSRQPPCRPHASRPGHPIGTERVSAAFAFLPGKDNAKK